ncbi:MAG: hypothetical protein Q8L15_11490 [Methylobacter sp.]|nr:hypothetical protein [Methylobacter sp.]
MKNKRYFSEGSIIQAGENMRRELSSHSSVRSTSSWAGKSGASKSAPELRIAFRKAIEKIS